MPRERKAPLGQECVWIKKGFILFSINKTKLLITFMLLIMISFRINNE